MVLVGAFRCKFWGFQLFLVLACFFDLFNLSALRWIRCWELWNLGPLVVPFCPSDFKGPLFLKPNSRKKGTLIIKRLLRSQGIV